MNKILDSIIRPFFGHKCYMCKKIIQKGNSAGEMQGEGYICIDCIIRPESKWGNIRTREDYFKYIGKKETTREEWNKRRAELNYLPMSKLEWFMYHGLD